MRKFFVKDQAKDLHTQYGFIKKDDFKKASGSLVATNTGKEMLILKPSFIDIFRKIKRGAQIIPRKDLGAIITETGINDKSVVADAGSGSGALACYLGHLCKEVHTFDIRDDHLDIVKHNIDFLGLSNITVAKHDVYESIPVKNADLITLDLPEPWKAVGNAVKSLKVGGFLVSYSPSIPQASDLIEEIRLNDSLIYIKSIEILEREWEFVQRKIRPKSQSIGHSGFMVFARKIMK